MKPSDFDKALEKTYHEHVTHTPDSWEDELRNRSYALKAGFVSEGDYVRLVEWIRSLLLAHEEKVQRGYDEIFSWLLGEKGDFPDLSTKPRYKFRPELRERLAHTKGLIIKE